ncbi:MAG: class I SAM-dependent methyltransferase [Rhizomicrobium sp.]
MNVLGQRIARLIEAQGPVSVAQFMTLALHDPQAGYYATRDPFGAGGDFVTAPEISQMFGEMLGIWVVQCWHDAGRPEARLVELGPGRGTLMSDALRAIAKLVPGFLSKVEIVLVEMSPALRTIQKNALEAAGANIRWVAQLDGTIRDKPLFLLANEFFDALPIRQFVKTERGWCERMVIAKGDGLAFALSPEPVPPGTIPANRASAPIGAFYETSPASAALVEQISEIIAGKGGGALIVDYGYGAEAGFGETLQAVAAHKYASVLAAPGDADLSAHVDFAALADAARAAGAAAFGPVAQGDLLQVLGIVQRAATLAKGQLGTGSEIDKQLERLVKPEQMGSLFKALAIVPKNARTPAGF